MIFGNDLVYLLPALYLAAGLLGLLLYEALLESAASASPAPLYTGRAFPLLLGLLGLLVWGQPRGSALYLNLLFQHSPLSLHLQLLLALLGLGLGLLLADHYARARAGLGGAYEHPLLMLLSLLGLYVLAALQDLLVLFLGIELLSLGLYVLAAAKRRSLASLEAGLKYFVLGALSSGILLLGLSLVYGALGMTNLLDLKYFFVLPGLPPAPLWYLFLAGLFLLLASLLFKLGAAPFHSWLPDVYAGAPTFVTAFFSLLPKVGLVGVLAKLCYGTLFGLWPYWSPLLLLAGLLSLAVGCLGALANLDLKRLMAYGTVNHLGFVLLGLACASAEGLQASLFYLAVYLLLSLNFFAFLLAFRQPGGRRLLREVPDGARLLALSPLAALLLALNLFSLAGVPPLAGFFGKFYLLYALLQSQLWLAALLAILTSALSCFYYLRLVGALLFEGARPGREGAGREGQGLAPGPAGVLLASTGFNLLFCLRPDLLLAPCYGVACSLLL